MRALSIRQPYAELILRGIKKIEYRSKPTRIVGERFHIYASKGKPPTLETAKGVWSRDLSTPARDGGPPSWMLEMWEMLRQGMLPTGVIVGSAVIERVTRGDEFYEWHLGRVERASTLQKPLGHPQPVWFQPF